jgi:hypothetical protein
MDWIGAQLTSQAVPPDEHRWIRVVWLQTEAAGLLAAFCLQKKMTLQQVHSERGLVEEFQGLLRTQGVELEWPTTHPV